jgi:hypothetical protein
MVIKSRQIREAGKAWRAGNGGDWWEIGGKVGKVVKEVEKWSNKNVY